MEGYWEPDYKIPRESKNLSTKVIKTESRIFKPQRKSTPDFTKYGCGWTFKPMTCQNAMMQAGHLSTV